MSYRSNYEQRRTWWGFWSWASAWEHARRQDDPWVKVEMLPSPEVAPEDVGFWELRSDGSGIARKVDE